MNKILISLIFTTITFAGTWVYTPSPSTVTCKKKANGASVDITTSTGSGSMIYRNCAPAIQVAAKFSSTDLLPCGIGQKLEEENNRCIAVKNYFDSLISSCGERVCSNFTKNTSEYNNCVATCKSNLEIQKANAISNSSPYDSNFENKETYIDIIDGKVGAVSYDLSDKTATFLPGATLDINETVVCPSHQYLVITNRMTVGTSGDIQFNSYECINKNQTTDYNGNPLEINYDNNGKLTDSTLSKEKYNYKIVCYSNGICEGIITDKDSKVLSK